MPRKTPVSSAEPPAAQRLHDALAELGAEMLLVGGLLHPLPAPGFVLPDAFTGQQAQAEAFFQPAHGMAQG